MNITTTTHHGYTITVPGGEHESDKDLELANMQRRLRVTEEGLDSVTHLLEKANSEIVELKAENERLRADAERYRFLRDTHWSDNTFAVVLQPKDAVRLGYECPSGLMLNARIDAARAALEKS